MELHLQFREGNLTGEGADDVGQFLIKGRYEVARLECYWTKSYVGAHDVFYRGFREGKGIWGTWEITVRDHGGFHIWPRGSGQGEEQHEGQAQTQTAEAAATVSAVPAGLAGFVRGREL